MLAHAIDVEAELVGELDLFHQVAQPLAGGDLLAGGRIERGFSECVEAEFHCQAEREPESNIGRWPFTVRNVDPSLRSG